MRKHCAGKSSKTCLDDSTAKQVQGQHMSALVKQALCVGFIWLHSWLDECSNVIMKVTASGVKNNENKKFTLRSEEVLL